MSQCQNEQIILCVEIVKSPKRSLSHVLQVENCSAFVAVILERMWAQTLSVLISTTLDKNWVWGHEFVGIFVRLLRIVCISGTLSHIGRYDIVFLYVTVCWSERNGLRLDSGVTWIFLFSASSHLFQDNEGFLHFVTLRKRGFAESGSFCHHKVTWNDAVNFFGTCFGIVKVWRKTRKY